MELQKQIGIRVIADYRTIALVSVLLLARILLVELQADLLAHLYKKKRKILENGIVDEGILDRYHRDLKKWSAYGKVK